MPFTINPYTGKFDLTGGTGGGTIPADQVTISVFLQGQLNGATNVEDALRELVTRTNFYHHTESPANATWNINHDLDLPIPPAITVIEATSGQTVIGYSITVVDNDNLTLNFCYPIEGDAYLIR